MITSFLLYMRNFQEVIGGITNNLQAIAKIHGAAYDISVLIVSPNKVVYEGTKILGDETEAEDLDTNVLSIEKVEFHYPTKPDVKVLSGVSIDVKPNQIVAVVGSSGKFKSFVDFLKVPGNRRSFPWWSVSMTQLPARSASTVKTSKTSTTSGSIKSS